MIEVLLIDAVLLFLVALTALAAVTLRNLVASVMMLAIYSLLLALVWINMDAVDVAFTFQSMPSMPLRPTLLCCRPTAMPTTPPSTGTSKIIM